MVEVEHCTQTHFQVHFQEETSEEGQQLSPGNGGFGEFGSETGENFGANGSHKSEQHQVEDHLSHILQQEHSRVANLVEVVVEGVSDGREAEPVLDVLLQIEEFELAD